MLTRGVWIAPWLGPNGDQILVAVRADARLLLPPEPVAPLQLASRSAFLWELLDDLDPEPNRATDARRRRTLKAI